VLTEQSSDCCIRVSRSCGIGFMVIFSAVEEYSFYSYKFRNSFRKYLGINLGIIGEVPERIIGKLITINVLKIHTFTRYHFNSHYESKLQKLQRIFYGYVYQPIYQSIHVQRFNVFANKEHRSTIVSHCLTIALTKIYQRVH